MTFPNNENRVETHAQRSSFNKKVNGEIQIIKGIHANEGLISLRK